MDESDRLRVLADLLPMLEPGGADFGHWEITPPSGDVHHLPYFEFGPAAESFRAAVGRGDWLMFGFDWRTWLQTDEGRAFRERPEVVSGATPDQLAMLLTAIVRSDRFVEGSIAGAYESGLLSRIVRRAATILADGESGS